MTPTELRPESVGDKSVVTLSQSANTATRAVNTASAVQVRQPLYVSSVGLWKKYENELEPLIKILKKEN